MSELIFHVLAWPTVGVALLVFGFTPGAVLRLIALVFHRDDPRRKELLAELHVVPRIERPFWVAEQLEVALFDVLRARLVIRRTEQAERDPWVLPEDGVLDPRAVEVAASGERRVRLTRREQRAAAARILAHGGTAWTIAKRLHLRYSVARALATSIAIKNGRD